MSQLEVARPDVLAGAFLQQNVVSKGISLNLPQCFQEGTGRSSWLLEIDTSKGMARTGSAHVQDHPAEGFCYLHEQVEGFQIEPVDVPVSTSTNAGETTFNTSQTIPTLTVALFLTDDESSAIILPLHDVLMSDGRISEDGNCIGSWAGDALSFLNNCKPDPSTNQRTQWLNGATVTGYIELEEADRVWIPEMTQTLCVALSGSASTYGEDFVEGDRAGRRCKRENGVIVAAERADWCATTNAACSPPQADSLRFQGGFAASAVKIVDSCP